MLSMQEERERDSVERMYADRRLTGLRVRKIQKKKTLQKVDFEAGTK